MKIRTFIFPILALGLRMVSIHAADDQWNEEAPQEAEEQVTDFLSEDLPPVEEQKEKEKPVQIRQTSTIKRYLINAVCWMGGIGLVWLVNSFWALAEDVNGKLAFFPLMSNLEKYAKTFARKKLINAEEFKKAFVFSLVKKSILDEWLQQEDLADADKGGGT